MTGRERFQKALAHELPDRIPYSDAPWGTTIRRWRREGMPEDVEPIDYFGFEIQGFGSDVSLRLEEKELEDTPDYTIKRNANGAILKNWKNQTSTPEFIDFTIKSAEDWRRLPSRSLEFTPDRVDPEVVRKVAAARATGRFITYSAPLGFNQAILLVGTEPMLIAMAADPAWAREILDFTATMAVEGAREMMRQGAVFDGAFMYDDMGYKYRPMFSPRMYEELVQPCHARVCAFFREQGLPVILHSCGNIMELLPGVIDSGFACYQAIEVKAGMDLIELKRRYGDRLAFMGGLDVRTFVDIDLMHQELERKIPVAMEGGGYILHSDHSIPDNVPLANFQEFLRYGLELGTYR